MKPATTILCAVAMAVILSGCASKEPIDYLPECALYLGANVSKMRGQAGARRLSKVLEALEPVGASNSDKIDRFTVGLQSLTMGGRPTLFGLMTGQAGLSRAFMEEAKKSGSATETKIDGQRAITVTGGAVFVELSDAAILMGSNQSDFSVMQQTARNKNPRAKTTLVYQRFNTLMADHGLVLVANMEPVLALARPQMAMVEKLDPKGYAALNTVKMASLAFDWESAPKLELNLYTENSDDGDALAALINSALMMIRMQAGMTQQMPAFLSDVTAKGTPRGAAVTLTFPKEQADELLAKAEKAVADLPTDPKERERAVERLFMDLVTETASGSSPAMDMRRSPGQLPGAAPPAASPPFAAPPATPAPAGP